MKQSKRQEAFLAIVEPVYPKLSRYALAITRNRDEAQDLIGDTVLAAFERFDEDSDSSRFAGLLFTIASRLHKRRRFRERFRVRYNAEAAESRHDSSPLPDRAAEIAIVMAALDQLPAMIKETVVLFDVADLSLDEIRSIQGGTLSGVKSRLTRGREQLKLNLGIITDPRKKNDEPSFDKLELAVTNPGEYYAL